MAVHLSVAFLIAGTIRKVSEGAVVAVDLSIPLNWTFRFQGVMEALAGALYWISVEEAALALPSKVALGRRFLVLSIQIEVD